MGEGRLEGEKGGEEGERLGGRETAAAGKEAGGQEKGGREQGEELEFLLVGDDGAGAEVLLLLELDVAGVDVVEVEKGVGGDGDEKSAWGGGGHLAEGVGVEAGHDGLAVVGDGLGGAVGVLDDERGGSGVAHADGDEPGVVGGELFGGLDGVRLHVLAVGDDDDVAVKVGGALEDGIADEADGVAEHGAAEGDGAVVDVVEAGEEEGGVVGERAGDLGVAGEDDEGDAVAADGLEALLDGEFGLFKTGGSAVRGKHGA